MAKPTKENVVDMHRQVSIDLLKSVSCFAVRTPKGQKDPGSVNWDPKANTIEKSRATIDTIQKTTDNLGVHLFGRTVDVDVDTDNSYLAESLDHFLPQTPHIWGRKSRPRTHRLYELAGAETEFDPRMFAFLDKIQSHDAIKLEVRGGEKKSGRYSLLPGSIHPSGEAYEWESIASARATPVYVDMYKLMDGVRMACVTALLAPYWQEGIRNELCKALCGFMHRAVTYSEDLAVEMPLDKDGAKSLLEGIMLVADDDPADYAMRMKTFEQTWEKADEGTPVLGASHIVKITGDNEILPLLYSLLAQTSDLQQLDALFERYAVIRNSISIVDLDMGSRNNYVMNKDAFSFTLQGQYITTMKGKVPISAVFLNSMQRTVVDRLSIDPKKGKIYEEGPDKIANVWTGWGIEPWEGYVTDEDVEPVTRYLKEVVCSHDEKLYNWVVSWMADIFQHPASKPGTALVMVGRQGAGKSVLAEKILRPIIGDAHSVKVGSVERLTSRFNSHMGGKLLIQGEEVISSKRRVDADMLKDAITSRKRNIELKGRDAFEMADFARYLFTSNHRDEAVSIEADDRRYTIVEVSPKYSHASKTPREEKLKFWRELHDFLEVGNETPHRENLAKFHAWLNKWEYDKTFIQSAIDTDVKRANIQTSTRGMDGWLLSLIEHTNPFDGLRDSDKGYAHSFVEGKHKLEQTEGWPDFVLYTLLEASYRIHTKDQRYDHRTAQQIARFFKDEGMILETGERKVTVSGKRVRVRPFPSLESIRRYLAERGYDVLDATEDGNDAQEDDEF